MLWPKLKRLEKLIEAQTEVIYNAKSSRTIKVDPKGPSDGQKGLSRGEIVQMKDMVVVTQAQNCANKVLNVVCRVASFKKDVDGLDESRKKEVRAIGFGGLLELKVEWLDRSFAYWLLTRVNPMNSFIVARDGRELPLAPIQWNFVFGLHSTRDPVPLTVEKKDISMKEEVLRIGKKIGKIKKGRSSIKIKKVEMTIKSKTVEEGDPIPLKIEIEKLDFRRAFMLVVLGKLLCCTTNGGNLSGALFPATAVVGDAEIYDWCSFVHE